MRPVLLAAWHRGPGRRLAARRLADAAIPAGTILPEPVPVLPAPPAGLSATHRARLLTRAGDAAAGDWHGPFPAAPQALTLDLFGPGDIRPVWERNRWAELPLLAQAARLAPEAGHLPRLEALLGDWTRRNPPFRGPNWACGQEAALRVLHLALSLALLGLEHAPSPASRTLLALHGRRIAATGAYALAQDNNHTVSEPAGLLICGLMLGEAGWTRHGARRLEAALRRLVAPDGAFAQCSSGYHRLLLDVLAATEWLRRRLGGPPLGAVAAARAAAATEWLRRVVDPASGAMPQLGHQDGSAFADLALAGVADARPSLERAARLFCNGSAGFAGEPGCAWLDLADQPALAPPPARWVAEGLRGWRAGETRCLLRTGPLRFRPGQADLLHCELWVGSLPLLRDGGTGAYNPPPEAGWWHAHFTGTAAHNTIAFDGEDQMPRLSRFLFSHWPRMGLLPEGAWLRDRRGRRHARRIRVEGRCWVVEDALEGRFHEAVLRWRLAPGAWRLRPDGAEDARARLTVTADVPLRCTLEPGWESPGYGQVRRVPVLTARVGPRARSLTTRIEPL
ncbi:heparinase II/III domain-containing protein [Roseicella frigidaeris]|uniref:heparinase II/III domain-containing protein n=1 Tax=Roseicella frigidaeris TaxID=2230885 RepID=UPI001FB46CA4|nr:heparinase II/III family protein [Roseicella frigidaeris]